MPIRRNRVSKQKEIMEAIILDDEDRAVLENHCWWINKFGYAQTKLNGKHLTLHHLIMGKPPMGFVVDHKNGSKLDNRKSNLHFVSPSYNLSNKKKRSDSSQPYKGIQLLPSGKWRAKGSGGKQIGSVFKTSKEAYDAFLEYNKKLYGMEFYALT